MYKVFNDLTPHYQMALTLTVLLDENWSTDEYVQLSADETNIIRSSDPLNEGYDSSFNYNKIKYYNDSSLCYDEV